MDSSTKVKKTTTCLTPLEPEYNTTKRDAVYGGKADNGRGNSTGNIGVVNAPDMLPFELTQKHTKPLDVPLATNHIELPIFASTENELIVNKLESLEGKKDPERPRAKVNKYTCYATRGFCTFNHSMGRGVYGAELQKTLMRQANGLKHTLRCLKIRVPLTNRVATGMALGRWGSDDGKNELKETIMLGG